MSNYLWEAFWEAGEGRVLHSAEQMVINDPGSNSCVRHDIIVKHMFGSANSPCARELKDNVNPFQLHFPVLAIKLCRGVVGAGIVHRRNRNLHYGTAMSVLIKNNTLPCYPVS